MREVADIMTQAYQLQDGHIQLFYRLAEQTLNGVIITDKHKSIIYVNQAFMLSSGYTFGEVVGKNPRFLQSGLHDIHFYRKLWMDVRSKGEWQGEIWNKRKNGEIFVEWQNIMSFQDEMGNVTHYASIFTDITERKSIENKLMRSNSKLKRLSTADELTGIGNRRYFNTALEQHWSSAGSSGTSLSLMMIDIDYFKEYNDYYGHQQGDECLMQVASLIQEEVLAADPAACVARYGGEEFAVILPGTAAEACASLARRLIGTVHQRCLPHERSHLYRAVTVSIGCHTMTPPGEVSSAALVRGADEALYKAKLGGRNRVEVAG